MAEAVSKNQLKAVLLGGTGACGKLLLIEMLRSNNFSEITSLGRRKVTLPDDIKDINLEDEEVSGRLKQPIVGIHNGYKLTEPKWTFALYLKIRSVDFSSLV